MVAGDLEGKWRESVAAALERAGRSSVVVGALEGKGWEWESVTAALDGAV